MKSVWVVTGGFDGEGSTVIGVFASEEVARLRAKQIEEKFDFGSVAEYKVQKNLGMDSKDLSRLFYFLSGVIDELYDMGLSDIHDQRPYAAGRETAKEIVNDWFTAPNITIGDYIDTAMEELGVKKPE